MSKWRPLDPSKAPNHMAFCRTQIRQGSSEHPSETHSVPCAHQSPTSHVPTSSSADAHAHLARAPNTKLESDYTLKPEFYMSITLILRRHYKVSKPIPSVSKPIPSDCRNCSQIRSGP